MQLRLLARSLFQTLERYYITVAVLAKNGSGTLTRGELERLCAMTAQRISMLHEFEAPEFSDRNLFREFITQLRKTGILRLDEDGTLAFGDALDRLVAEAKNILSKEIRHGIIHLVPQVPEEGAPAEETGPETTDEREAAQAR
jgi:glycerol-3-phosphate O-acyltransferase